MPRGRATVLGPTYAEHARALNLAGHEVSIVTDAERLAEAQLAIVVNPNNPDGRIIDKERLLALGERLRARGGLLVVDEAFMDVGPQAASLAAAAVRGSVAVLRSFGKFSGLAGLRLSFAIASPDMAATLKSTLGPWPVSGAALAVGCEALADRAWIEDTRACLAGDARRLDGLLYGAGLEVIGGTSLFRLIRTADAAEPFRRLGQAGVLVRRFAEAPDRLRFGLPGPEQEWSRLEAALRL